MGINNRIQQEFSLLSQTYHFGAGTKPGVEGKDSFAPVVRPIIIYEIRTNTLIASASARRLLLRALQFSKDGLINRL